MIRHIKNQLLAMQTRDTEVRAAIEALGILFEGYHPEMQAVHRENANQLRLIIQDHGWPHEQKVGPEAAEAAWLIAQHSIGEPAFMRQCRNWLDEASQLRLVPRWQFAYIDDRIRVFEGKLQRFGTQIDIKPTGAEVHGLEDPSQVEAWRNEAGLGTLKKALAAFHGCVPPSKAEYSANQAQSDAWRQSVGWV